MVAASESASRTAPSHQMSPDTSLNAMPISETNNSNANTKAKKITNRSIFLAEWLAANPGRDNKAAEAVWNKMSKEGKEEYKVKAKDAQTAKKAQRIKASKNASSSTSPCLAYPMTVGRTGGRGDDGTMGRMVPNGHNIL
ncbi:hypothetical protein VKT23_010216 [Stygiomarasmius scandens]|uniref:Uncharacterized protein n=1 Tax=Marasmiellus scandens TaxID=2682957 RepID=A0ABR1JEV8_9AGAR